MPEIKIYFTPHKEHTASAIRKDHLSPCRFIGISQPLAQLQRRNPTRIASPRATPPAGRNLRPGQMFSKECEFHLTFPGFVALSIVADPTIKKRIIK